MAESTPDSIDDVGDRVQRGARNGAARASGEMPNLLADVEHLIGRVTHIDDARLARVRQQIEASIGRARETVVRGTRQARERVVAAGSAADDYAHDRPWVLVGAAAIIGLALGAILSRR